MADRGRRRRHGRGWRRSSLSPQLPVFMPKLLALLGSRDVRGIDAHDDKTVDVETERSTSDQQQNVGRNSSE